MKTFMFCMGLMAFFTLHLFGQGNALYPTPSYDTLENQNLCKITYSDTSGNIYLQKFRNTFRLDTIIQQNTPDLKKAMALLHWSNRQWKHQGSNAASEQDAFVILEEAGKGKMFRCVEYATVFTTAANAVGLKARVLNLKRKNAATIASGGGHVVAEVYVQELNKWVMCDPQNDLVAFNDSLPLNAVEFRSVIDHHRNKLRVNYKNTWVSDKFENQVVNWFYPYLYFYDIAFDQRSDKQETNTCMENKNLILVPQGEKAPTVFQKKYPMEGFLTTYSVGDFYHEPL